MESNKMYNNSRYTKEKILATCNTDVFQRYISTYQKKKKELLKYITLLSVNMVNNHCDMYNII